jgi:hypothetical protein
VLRGVAGTDHLDGSAGFDIALYNESSATVAVSFATGTGHGGMPRATWTAGRGR